MRKLALLIGVTALCLALAFSTACARVTTEPFDKSRIVDISFGNTHSVMILNDGSAWTVGSNSYQQLGVPNNDPRLEKSSIKDPYNPYTNGEQKIAFHPIRIMEDVKEAIAGPGWSLFLKNDNTLWATGNRDYLWTAPASPSDAVNQYPKLMPPTEILENVTHIAAGNHHILLLKTDGSLWGMGSNAYGQLGVTQNTVKTSAPLAETTEIIPSGVATIFAGADSSFILMQDGRLLSCGTGALGYNLSSVAGGLDNKSANFPPKEVVLQNIVKVSAGTTQTLFLDKNGVLYKSNVFANIQPRKLLEGVADMVSADQSFLVLMKDGSMVNTNLANVGTNIRQAFIGNWQTLTISANGEVKLDGDNTYGQVLR
jgi:alpha-tubulin suppressor-like RCC1 family protein